MTVENHKKDSDSPKKKNFSFLFISLFSFLALYAGNLIIDHHDLILKFIFTKESLLLIFFICITIAAYFRDQKQENRHTSKLKQLEQVFHKHLQALKTSTTQGPVSIQANPLFPQYYKAIIFNDSDPHLKAFLIPESSDSTIHINDSETTPKTHSTLVDKGVDVFVLKPTKTSQFKGSSLFQPKPFSQHHFSFIFTHQLIHLN